MTPELFIIGLVCVILIIISVLSNDDLWFVIALVIALLTGVYQANKEVPRETYRTPVVINNKYRCVNKTAYEKVDNSWKERKDLWTLCS